VIFVRRRPGAPALGGTQVRQEFSDEELTREFESPPGQFKAPVTWRKMENGGKFLN